MVRIKLTFLFVFVFFIFCFSGVGLCVVLEYFWTIFGGGARDVRHNESSHQSAHAVLLLSMLFFVVVVDMTSTM